MLWSGIEAAAVLFCVFEVSWTESVQLRQKKNQDVCLQIYRDFSKLTLENPVKANRFNVKWNVTLSDNVTAVHVFLFVCLTCDFSSGLSVSSPVLQEEIIVGSVRHPEFQRVFQHDFFRSDPHPHTHLRWAARAVSNARSHSHIPPITAAAAAAAVWWIMNSASETVYFRFSCSRIRRGTFISLSLPRFSS